MMKYENWPHKFVNVTKSSNREGQSSIFLIFIIYFYSIFLIQFITLNNGVLLPTSNDMRRLNQLEIEWTKLAKSSINEYCIDENVYIALMKMYISY